MNLSERLLAIHRSLEEAGVPHAFGGAISLSYWTLNPRGTSDIDVNVFVAADRAASVLATLPDGVERLPGAAEQIRRDGQIRLWWDETPVDLFFDYEPIHADAATHARPVPFSGTEIPVLGPVELAVFKAMFDRSRDWADIEEMAGAGTLDVDAVRAALEKLVGDGDPRFAKLDEAVRRANEG
jgi:hypothetical protein